MTMGKISKLFFAMSALKFIFILSIITSLFLWSIPFLSSSTGVWSFLQERSGVTIDDNEAGFYNTLIEDFIRHGDDLPFLNEIEALHMDEVRQIILISNVTFFVSFIALLSSFDHFSRKDRNFLVTALRRTSLFVLALTFAIMLAFLASFDFVFLIFHKVLFVENFVFPANSILKTLYPDRFFLGMLIIYLFCTMTVSLLVAVISHRLKLK